MNESVYAESHSIAPKGSPKQHAARWKALAKHLLVYKRECESISRELDLPKRIRPAEGAFSKMKSDAGQYRDARAILERLVKYCREDGAETPGSTRLARFLLKVEDYLGRTREPHVILRSGNAQGASEAELAEWRDGKRRVFWRVRWTHATIGPAYVTDTVLEMARATARDLGGKVYRVTVRPKKKAAHKY